MDYRHREVIKKYTLTLQKSIDLHALKESLSKSKIFTTYMIKDIYDGEASFFEELPTRGPEAFFHFINLLKTSGYAPIAEELLHVANPAYQISHQHGYYFILLNCGFQGILSSQEWKDFQKACQLEAFSLESALAQIGYENHKYKVNLSSDELDSFLKEFSKMDFSNVNSCIFIILGLGAKNKDSKVIYGNDGKYILLHDIVNLFSDSNCPSLKYKPKIFLLSSFDICHNDFVENIEILPNVNDTFLWYFPSVKNYNLVIEKNCQFFGNILSENLKDNYLKSDFEAIFKSSYSKFKGQLSERDLNIPECERLGNCREKILFTLKS